MGLESRSCQPGVPQVRAVGKRGPGAVLPEGPPAHPYPVPGRLTDALCPDAQGSPPAPRPSWAWM